jgi:hypothetical protein
MARKSLIAVPLRAERYHHKPVCLHTIAVFLDKTQILHYQGFYGHMPAGHYVYMHFSVRSYVV